MLRLTAALALLAPSAYAGGLEIPDLGARAVSRGGAFTAKADDPTAVAHNPGAVSKLKGLQFAWNHNLLWSNLAFTRSESVIPDTRSGAKDDAPFERQENETPLFALGGFLAATYELPVEGLVVGLSVFGPSGSGHAEYSNTGGQRFMITETDALILYYSLSVAWGTDTYGFGATLQWADLAKLDYKMVVDGTTASTLNPYGSTTIVEGHISVKDRFAPAAILGAWWKPIPSIELGLSGRPFPIVFEAEGDVSVTNVADGGTFNEQQLEIDDSSAAFDLVLPATAHIGARYVHDDLFDIELDFVWEGWSEVERYDIDLEGIIALFGRDEAQDAIIERSWKDALSLRLGGTYNVLDWLGVSAGGYWERGVMPDNYAHLDLLSLDRLGVGGGFEMDFGKVEFVVAYMHTFQPDLSVDEEFGKVYQQRPVTPCPDGCQGLSGVPANAGKFESSYDMVSIAVGGKL